MMFFYICISILVVVILSTWIYKMQHGKCYSKTRLEGKVAIVTGGSAGIGKETARDLARRGARVILACRNKEKAAKVAEEIIRDTGNSSVEVQLLDTCSLASVRQFAKHFVGTESQLHILVNNAGIGGTTTKTLTDDGLETTMATNHYGHFLLTNLLGGLLKASAPSRVVCVSSLAHRFVHKLDPDDLNFRAVPFTTMTVYAYSKLCNLLMARELARRTHDTGVTTYSLHPGVVDTEIFSKSPNKVANFFGYVAKIFGKSSETGAQTSIYCAVDEAAGKESGLYYVDCKTVLSSALGQHNGLARKVWDASALDVKLQDDEDNFAE